MSAQLTIYNDLTSRINAVTLSVDSGITIDQCLSALTPNYKTGVDQPFLVRINGREIDSRHFTTRKIQPDDAIVLRPRPFDPLTLTYVLYAVTAASLIYSYTQMQGLKDTNSNYKSLPEQSSTNDHNAQGNLARLKQSVPVGYGRMRVWPDFTAVPYKRYIDGKQYLFHVFTIGEGYYELIDKKVGSTPLANFSDYEEQLCAPGEQVTIFHPEMYTSPEVSNVELFAPNDEKYTGVTVAYVAAPDDRNIVGVEVDLICPQLLKQNKKNGKLERVSLTVEAEYSAINDANEPDGNWISLGDTTLTGATVDPVRYTFTASLPAGRYAVRAVRTSASPDPDASNIQDNVFLAQIRGVIDSASTYAETVWAVKILIDDQLAGKAETKFNVYRQRLLPVWTGTDWTAPQATRNPAWAFCDAVKAEHGATFNDSMLDLVTIAHYADVWESRQDYFDYNFDTKGTIHSVLTMICAAGRAKKIEYKGVYTIVRDEPKALPDLVVGMNEMIANSYTENYILHDQWDNDGVIIEYHDGETGLPFEVLCVLPGKSGTNPLTIKKEGITNAAQAYREGMFEAAAREYRTLECSYKTDTLGALCEYGSVVSINTYHSKYGTSGVVVESETDESGRITLQLSEPVTFEQGQTHVIMLSSTRGKPQGVYVAQALSDPYTLRINSPGTLTLQTNPNKKRTAFQFGKAEAYGLQFITRSAKETGEYQWQVSGELDDPRVHQFDDLIADGTLPVPEPETIITKELTQVSGVRFSYTGSITSLVLNLSWNPVSNAEQYITQIRYSDDEQWQNFSTTHNLWTKGLVGALTGRIRIAAQNIAVGPWFELDVSLDSEDDIARPTTPTGVALAEPFEGPTLKLECDEQIDAVAFRTAICTPDGTAKRLFDFVGTTFEYTSDMAKNDGVGRDILVKLWAVGEDGRLSYSYAELLANNPQIGALANIQTADFIESGMITVDRPSAPDFSAFLVWMSPEQGFTPDETNLVLRSDSYVLDIPKTGVQYARIAGVDVWGDDNPAISAEITFTASKILDSQLNDDLKAAIDSIGGTGEGSLAWQIAQEAAARAQADADEAQARADALTQEANDRNAEIIAAVAEEATARGSAIAQEAGTRQSADEALAFDVAALQSAVNNPTTGLAATASALTETHTLAEQNEEAISAQAGTISSIQSSINDLTISEFNASTNYAVDKLFRYNDVIYQVIATQSQPNATPPNATYYEAKPDYASLADVVSANSGAIDALNTKTTQTANKLTTEAEKVAALQSEIVGKASTSAVDELLTEVELLDDEVTAQSSKITDLEAGRQGANLLPAEYADPSSLEVLPYYTFTNQTVEIFDYDDTTFGSYATYINGRKRLIRSNATAANGTLNIPIDIPVTPGGTYIFSVYVMQWGNSSALTANNVQLYMMPKKANGDWDNWRAVSISVDANNPTRISQTVTMSDETQTVRLRIDNDSYNGTGVAYQTYACFQFEQAKPGQTEPSPWVPGTVTARAIESINATLTETADSLTIEAGKITNLQTQIGDKADSSVLSTQISRIDDAEGAISALGQDVTGITTTLSGKASASAVNTLTARVTETEDDIEAIASATFKVQTRSSDGALVAAGIGLEASGDGSLILLRADRIGLIGSSTADQLALSVEGGKTVIPNAAIGTLAVKDGNVESLKVTKVTGTAGEFQTLLANKLKVTSAMIDDTIQSTNYSSSQGWRIEKDGAATFNDVKVRGDVEATSLKANTANIVETLHVADGAITVGASYYDGSTDEFDADDGEVTICTLVFNPQGGRTVANVGFIYRPPIRTANSGTVLYETSGTLWIRFKKNGSTVRTLSISWSTYGQRPSIPFSYPFVDASPGSSNATYTVTAETSYEDGYRMMAINQKSMVIDGAKR